jgi:hypothetical protein
VIGFGKKYKRKLLKKGRAKLNKENKIKSC